MPDGRLTRQTDPGSEVLALADGIVEETQATNDANTSTSAQDSPAKGGKKSQKGGKKGKGPKKKKK